MKRNGTELLSFRRRASCPDTLTELETNESCNFMPHRNVDDGTRSLLLHQMPTALRAGAFSASLIFLLTFQPLFIKPQCTSRRK
jgi:hypothetical protein